MSNHIHGILVFVAADHGRPLPTVIALFKQAVSRRIGWSPWQRSFYDRVIRNEDEVRLIRQYIANNPVKWAVDRENPAHRGRRT